MLLRRSHPTNFAKVATANIQRSAFNRSFGYKTTFDSGYLIPFFCQEVLPGDTHTVKPLIFARLSTPIVPFMDNLYLDTFFFFVPNRLVWEHWKEFCGEQKNPGDSIDYIIPMLTAPSGGYDVGSVYDYFALPTGVGNFKHSALPFRAMNLIYNEWFRDENLQDSLPVNLTDSTADETYSLFRRGKRHDYFTSCLPWPQKGPGVELPLTGNAPICFDGPPNPGTLSVPEIQWIGTPSGSPSGYHYSLEHDMNGSYVTISQDQGSWPPSGTTARNLVADLSSVSSATINSLRQAFQIQRLLERDARGGTRYIELILSHFGVKSSDARLQRPEYLGGGSSPIIVNPVMQTSATGQDSTPQGNLSAFAYVNHKKGGFSKSFEEHGYIIGFMSVRADLNYQQGLQRFWSRSTRYDFYWPVLAHLGEQAVLNKEIYCQGTEEDEKVFGYQERWAEYRYEPNKITGKMRSTYAQSLDIWHLAQKFDSLPVLNDEFIQDNPPVKRVLAVQDEPEFIADVWFNYSCVRPMPVRSTPGLVDHF